MEDYERLRASTSQYYPRFSDEEYERRHRTIRQAMDEHELDCLVIYGDSGMSGHNQANTRYLCNYIDHYFTYVVFPRDDEPTLFCKLYCHLPNAMAVSPIRDVRVSGLNPSAIIARRIRELGLEKGSIGTVGVDTLNPSIPHDHYVILKEKLPGARFKNFTPIYEGIRLIASPEEIKFLEKGAELTDLAMEALVDAVKPGVKDYELYAISHCSYLRRGGSFFFSLIGSTPMSNPTMPYPWPLGYWSNRVIQPGDIVISEISGSYFGYSGQINRSIALGQPTKEYWNIFDLALEAYEEIRQLLKPGRRKKDIMRVDARIRERGFVMQAPLVHGWGLNVGPPMMDFFKISDEVGMPRLPPEFTHMELKENMTVVIHPNICTPDLRRGIYLGNMCRITSNGAQSYQKYPLEFIVKQV